MDKNTKHLRWGIVSRRIFCVLLFAIMLCAALGTSTMEHFYEMGAQGVEINFERLAERLERIGERLERLEDICTCLVNPSICDIPLRAED